MKQKIKIAATLLLLVVLTACTSAGVATVSTIPVVVTDTEVGTIQTIESVTSDNSVQSMGDTHDNVADYTWDTASEVTVTLNGDNLSASGEGITANGSQAVITSAGNYRISGTLTNGQITVSTDEKGTVRLILDNAVINNASGSPVFIEKAEKVIIVLVDGSQNTLTDGATYLFANPDEDEPNAVLFSKADLTITGNGALTINGNYEDGINGKDCLIIDSGTISVNAVDDGIRGKDYLVIKSGSVSVVSTGDGLKSDNSEDTATGFVQILTGVINVLSGGDAISAQSDIVISGGEFSLTSGGGSTQTIADTLSAKAIKADGNITVENGVFVIDSAEDAIHAGGTLTVNNGTFSISSGDDGMHSDTAVTINNGTVNIQKSYEGIEGAVITLNGGEINIKASDDGINVSTGTGEGEMMGRGGQMGPGMGEAAGQESFTYTGSNYLYINGGMILVDADGDGLDSNGAVEMTGGLVIVNGPIENMNGALDYDSGFKMNGGILIAAGSAGMAQAPGSYSSQNSLLVNFDAAQAAGTIVSIRTAAGEDVITFAPAKSFQSLLVSSPDLVTGQTYQIYLGGSSSETNLNGLFEGGAYSGGTLYQEATLSSVITTLGSAGGFMGGPGGGMGGRGGPGGGQPIQQ